MKKRLLATFMAASMLTGTLAGAAEVKEPQWLLESVGKWATPVNEGVNNPTGWDIDRRGGQVTENNTASINVLDTSEDYPIVMSHAVEPRTSGKITYEASLKFMDIYPGFYLNLMNEDGEKAVSFGIDNGWLVYKDGKKGNIKMQRIEENQWIRIKVIADIDSNTAEISVGGRLVGIQSFTEDTSKIDMVRLETPAEKEMSLQIGYMNMYENYLINEGFFSGEFPYDWECVSVENDAVTVTPLEAGMRYQNLTIKDTNIIDNTVVKKVFEKSKGNIVCEFRFLASEKSDGMSFMLNNEEETAIKLGIKKGNLVNASGEVLTEISDFMWHIIRMEANTETNKVLVKYNGRNLVELPFDEACEYIDRLEFATSVKGRGEITIRDVVAFVKPELAEDYPSVPDVPKDPDDVTVCMQVCDLWHENHIGWDVISTYENRIPYLGWYDDTKPEVSDWEIKWMSEHGVDAALKCWYMEEDAYKGQPFDPIASNSAMNAFYNAEYSDYLDYGLLVCSYPHSSDPVGHWKNWIVPYWIEQFFKDDRYLVVDNKPVIYFFGWGGFENVFGEPASVKEQLDYLRSECKKAGFDGAYLIAYAQHEAELTKAKESGFDNIFLYSWGRESYKASHQINSMEKHYNWNIIDSIPNITMGYNDAAWNAGTEIPYATSETFMEVAQYVKNDLMPRFDKKSLSSRMITVDNWNEWGEGHFVNPSSLNGFGYLDVIREIFTEGGEHTDDIPTQNQKDRLNNRRPGDRKWLRYLPSGEEVLPTKVQKGWYFNNEADFNEWKIEKQLESIALKNGAMVGKSSGNDGGIVMVNDIGINISNSPYIKIRMKSGGEADSAEVFFTTVENNKWTQAQSAKVDIVPGEYTDYYFKVENNKYWNGVLNKIRFDMSVYSGTEFEIESIEVLENDSIPVSLYIDGVQQAYKGETIIKNGTTVIPTWPLQGWQDALHCAVIYNNNYKTVNVIHEDAEIVFTVGSDTVKVNGREQKLTAPIEIVDNLPNLPIRFIAETIGDTVSWNGAANAIEITTKESLEEPEVYYDISTRVPNEYEFELKGDFEGWSASTQFYFSRARVEDGVMSLKAMNIDPQISRKVELDSSKYKTITVRVKNESDCNTMQIFWASSVTGGISSTNCVAQGISTRNEEFVEYTFDMSQNDGWAGTITQLRIDPINGLGSILFDYIRISE